MTPRTDAAIRERWETHSCEEVPASLARDLERELARETARLDWMLENVGKHYAPMCHDRAAINSFLSVPNQ
jgi:hypothetical protein